MLNNEFVYIQILFYIQIILLAVPFTHIYGNFDNYGKKQLQRKEFSQDIQIQPQYKNGFFKVQNDKNFDLFIFMLHMINQIQQSTFIIMQKDRKQISNYLSAIYLKSITQFEIFVEEAIHINFQYEKIPIASNQQLENINLEQMSSLRQGINHNKAIRVICLRRIDLKQISLLLTFDRDPLVDKFIYVAILMPKNQLLRQQWYQYTNLYVQIVLHQPYNVSANSRMRYLIVNLENIKVQKGLKTRENWHIIKTQANLLYKNRQYQQAFRTYEYALCNINQYDQKRQRTILYSNSSACLYEMKLYESSIEYANIAIRLDPSYPKSYGRKINSLLQLRMFAEVPICMSQLESQINRTEFKIIKQKYLTYLANDIGIYKWPQIFRNSSQFGQYFSQKISKQSSRYYTVNCNIEASELIFVNKPSIYMRIGGQFRKKFPKLLQQVYRYSCLQKSFYEDIKTLPCICHPEGGIGPQVEQECNKKCMFTKKELGSKIQRCVVMERFLEKINQEVGYGIWKHMFSLQQHCYPNCTFVHVKSTLVVFATRAIQKGQVLTIDCFSDLDPKTRTEIMKIKLGSQCHCQYCISRLLSTQQNSQKCSWMQKYLIWNRLCQPSKQNSKKQQNKQLASTLYPYILLIEQETTWEDILNLLRLMRDQQQADIRYKLRLALQKFFEKYFKISQKESQELLNIIQ